MIKIRCKHGGIIMTYCPSCKEQGAMVELSFDNLSQTATLEYFCEHCHKTYEAHAKCFRSINEPSDALIEIDCEESAPVVKLLGIKQ